MTVQRIEARRPAYSPVKARLRLTIGKQRTKMGKLPSVKEYVNLNL